MKPALVSRRLWLRSWRRSPQARLNVSRRLHNSAVIIRRRGHTCAPLVGPHSGATICRTNQARRTREPTEGTRQRRKEGQKHRWQPKRHHEQIKGSQRARGKVQQNRREAIRFRRRRLLHRQRNRSVIVASPPPHPPSIELIVGSRSPHSAAIERNRRWYRDRATIQSLVTNPIAEVPMLEVLESRARRQAARWCRTQCRDPFGDRGAVSVASPGLRRAGRNPCSSTFRPQPPHARRAPPVETITHTVSLTLVDRSYPVFVAPTVVPTTRQPSALGGASIDISLPRAWAAAVEALGAVAAGDDPRATEWSRTELLMRITSSAKPRYRDTPPGRHRGPRAHSVRRRYPRQDRREHYSSSLIDARPIHPGGARRPAGVPIQAGRGWRAPRSIAGRNAV